MAESRTRIVGGTPSDHAGIVQLVGRGPCTGALIAPKVVLTAKHCVTSFQGGGPFECDETGELATDPDAPVQYVGAGEFDEVVEADAIHVWAVSPYAPRGEQIFVSEGGTICRSDTALVVLDRPVDDGELVPLRLDAPPTGGEHLTAVGFGQHEEGSTSTVLLAREVTVLEIGPKPEEPGVTGAVQPGFFTTSEGVCRGDSGSPALSASGVVVGVASTVGREDLDTFSGTAQDCIGDPVRVGYEAVATEADFIESTLAAVGASPWHEGEPDPRAGLSGFEEPCQDDADCRSMVCVPYDETGSRCSQGCLVSDCPESYRCEVVQERKRCIWSAPEPSEPPAPGNDDGCTTSRTSGSGRRSGWWALVGALLFLRRRSDRLAPHRVS